MIRLSIPLEPRRPGRTGRTGAELVTADAWAGLELANLNSTAAD